MQRAFKPFRKLNEMTNDGLMPHTKQDYTVCAHMPIFVNTTAHHSSVAASLARRLGPTFERGDVVYMHDGRPLSIKVCETSA